LQMQRAKEMKDVMGLSDNDMLATCIYGVLSLDLGGFINVRGDGAVAILLKDGTRVFYAYEWAENKPFYPLAYHGEMLEAFREALPEEGRFICEILATTNHVEPAIDPLSTDHIDGEIVELQAWLDHVEGLIKDYEKSFIFSKIEPTEPPYNPPIFMQPAPQGKYESENGYKKRLDWHQQVCNEKVEQYNRDYNRLINDYKTKRELYDNEFQQHQTLVAKNKPRLACFLLERERVLKQLCEKQQAKKKFLEILRYWNCPKDKKNFVIIRELISVEEGINGTTLWFTPEDLKTIETIAVFTDGIGQIRGLEGWKAMDSFLLVNKMYMDIANDIANKLIGRDGRNHDDLSVVMMHFGRDPGKPMHAPLNIQVVERPVLQPAMAKPVLQPAMAKVELVNSVHKENNIIKWIKRNVKRFFSTRVVG
jgi:hypothetical protein